MKKVALFAIIGLFASMQTAAEIYKCTSPTGEIDYSDVPCPGESVIFTPRSGPTADQHLNKRKARTQRLLRAIEEERAIKQQKTDDLEAEENQRQLNCQIAKERFALASRTGRLYRKDAAGKRTYLSDAQRKTAIAEEEAHIRHWCE